MSICTVALGLPIEELRGGDSEVNAKALQGVLDGNKSAYRDMVLLNTGAALMIAGLAEDLKSGAELAAQSIDSGAAKTALANLVAASQES